MPVLAVGVHVLCRLMGPSILPLLLRQRAEEGEALGSQSVLESTEGDLDPVTNIMINTRCTAFPSPGSQVLWANEAPRLQRIGFQSGLS